jgi:hypothetical protein
MGFFDWLLECLIRESAELPIGSVRDHAIAHIKVDLQGAYYLNGKRVSIEEVQVECVRLNKFKGLVLYYRDKPNEAGPPEAIAVVNAICATGVPLAFAGRDYDPKVKVGDYFLLERGC